MNKTITVETVVEKDIDTVWESWTKPEHITKWNFASDDWECPRAENEMAVGGRFSSRMSSKDGSQGFDFGGVYNEIETNKHIAYTMDDRRKVDVTFSEEEDGVRIIETFEMENENTEELQRSGWQAILDNFKKYVEMDRE